eukprot:TRINITY_DN36964_c0_g1_i1.p1 TRINITY_DN36964_c0_g1~~TRINITY_DN36964_c0_g1_i1.p1  ORF type:complete len:520 (-),score=60.73 TRINITY_DN36964_c0_g1_i1:149-1708(-)
MVEEQQYAKPSADTLSTVAGYSTASCNVKGSCGAASPAGPPVVEPHRVGCLSVQIIDRHQGWLASPTRYLMHTTLSHGTVVGSVLRRYREFRELDKYLRPRLLLRLPRFPRKEIFSRLLGRPFLDSRQAELQEWLNGVISVLPYLDDHRLQRFLNVDTAWVDRIRAPGAMMQMPASPSLLMPRVFRDRGGSELEPRSPATFSDVSDCSSARNTRMSEPGINIGHVLQARTFPQGRLQRKLLETILYEESLRVSVQAGNEANEDFQNFAKIIARDVKRIYVGHPAVDCLRVLIINVLRSYAQRDPEVGYQQGMCFAAAVVCLRCRCGLSRHRSPSCLRADEGESTPSFRKAVLSAEAVDVEPSELTDTAFTAFVDLMDKLRNIWAPGFSMVAKGAPLLEKLLEDRDEQLSAHFLFLDADLPAIITSAWLSIFAKWLPLVRLLDVVPFVEREGLMGFLAVTLTLLLHHRGDLLLIDDFGNLLRFLNELSHHTAPDDLVDRCRQSLPGLRAWSEEHALFTDF